jgi:hypothetical protein
MAATARLSKEVERNFDRVVTAGHPHTDLQKDAPSNPTSQGEGK